MHSHARSLVCTGSIDYHLEFLGIYKASTFLLLSRLRQPLSITCVQETSHPTKCGPSVSFLFSVCSSELLHPPRSSSRASRLLVALKRVKSGPTCAFPSRSRPPSLGFFHSDLPTSPKEVVPVGQLFVFTFMAECFCVLKRLTGCLCLSTIPSAIAVEIIQYAYEFAPEPTNEFINDFVNSVCD